jgi:RecF/RecN/SMC N terminal domain
MYIEQIQLNGYKRFSELTVRLPEPVRLVMLCGPNGSGKSSLLEAMKLWHDVTSNELGRGGGPEYHIKGEWSKPQDWAESVAVELHEDDVPRADLHRVMYFRTAYRNEPEFALGGITRLPGSLLTNRPQRMIDNDVRVSVNYQVLVTRSIDLLYAETDSTVSAVDLRERLVGPLRDVVSSVLPDLELRGLTDPLSAGTFHFSKGISESFPYMLLSGGEKAVFDLLLDLFVKGSELRAPVICIDEPEAHTNPVVHGKMLDALLELAGGDSQLWLATHSVGMLRRARDLAEQAPGSVAFLDFSKSDFDEPQELTPVTLSRAFWKRTLASSLGDVAHLVAPGTLVLCEGQPSRGDRAEFDARCLRAVFGESEPDVDFVAVGNDREVIKDEQGVGRAMQAMVPGTTVIRLIDHDDRSPQEVSDRESEGVTVLSRRTLESYLLDEEVLEAFCASVGQPERWPEIQTARQEALQSAVDGGKPVNDWKAAKGDIYNACKKVFRLTGVGSTADRFMAEQLAPLLKPGMSTYAELRSDVFGRTDSDRRGAEGLPARLRPG